jgi:hypothetical protein
VYYVTQTDGWDLYGNPCRIQILHVQVGPGRWEHFTTVNNLPALRLPDGRLIAVVVLTEDAKGTNPA